MEVSEKKTIKLTAIITYSIAIACLLLGLFLPLFKGVETKGILALQLPDVFNAVANKQILKFGKDFTLNYPVYLFGAGKKPFDLMAWVVLLYAVITLVGLICLIPMGLSYKKGSKTIVIISYIIETAAVLVLSLYFIVMLQNLPIKELSINMLVAAGGALLMLIIVSLTVKKKTGAVKFFLLLFSIVAMFALFNVYMLIPKLKNPVGVKLAEKLKCSPLSTFAFVWGENGPTYCSSYLSIVFEEKIKTFFNLCINAKEKAAFCLSVIIALVALFNLFTDVIGLSTNAKRKGLIFNCVRYGVLLLAAVCLFVTIAVMKFNPPLLLCLMFIAVGIQAIISAIRLALSYKKKAVQTDSDVQLEIEPQPGYEPQPVEETSAQPEEEQPQPEILADDNYYQPNFITDDASEEFKDPFASTTYSPSEKTQVTDYKPVSDYVPEPPPYKPLEEIQTMPDYSQPPQAPVPNTVEPVTHNVYQTYTPKTPQREEPVENIYKVNTVYQGPTDEFMKKLSNNEKIEFSQIFIEKCKGDIGKVPDYIIGGDNRKFFTSVFIYLGRMRSMVSDGLLNKMYKELNML